jgi:hypothetical protein
VLRSQHQCSPLQLYKPLQAASLLYLDKALNTRAAATAATPAPSASDTLLGSQVGTAARERLQPRQEQRVCQ